MQRSKVKCKHCGKDISLSNISRHEESCKIKPVKNGKNYALTHDGLVCQFCSKVCKNRNSLCNHERLCKLNPDRQVSAGFVKFNEARKTGLIEVWNKGLTSKTDERVAKQAKSLSEYYEVNPAVWQGKQHTEETRQKISLARKQYLLDHPDQVPYKLNHSSKESYPEKYFADLFETEGINLHREYYCLGYYLDFCDSDKKIDIEIDGEQHYLDQKIVAHDKVRSATLEAAGWRIFRIRWATYQQSSKEDKIKIINKIKQLLN